MRPGFFSFRATGTAAVGFRPTSPEIWTFPRALPALPRQNRKHLSRWYQTCRIRAARRVRAARIAIRTTWKSLRPKRTDKHPVVGLVALGLLVRRSFQQAFLRCGGERQCGVKLRISSLTGPRVPRNFCARKFLQQRTSRPRGCCSAVFAHHRGGSAPQPIPGTFCLTCQT